MADVLKDELASDPLGRIYSVHAQADPNVQVDFGCPVYLGE